MNIKTKRYNVIIGVISLFFAMSACNRSTQNKPFFPAKYPGIPNAIIDARKIVLSNEALFAEWELQNSIISLKTIITVFWNGL